MPLAVTGRFHFGGNARPARVARVNESPRIILLFLSSLKYDLRKARVAGQEPRNFFCYTP